MAISGSDSFFIFIIRVHPWLIVFSFIDWKENLHTFGT